MTNPPTPLSDDAVALREKIARLSNVAAGWDVVYAYSEFPESWPVFRAEISAILQAIEGEG